MEQVEDLKLDNPALYMGSSFGEFLQMCHKTGVYQKMLDFTSVVTREKYGDSTLLDYFQKMQFSYPLKLKAIRQKGGKFTLFYSTKIFATEKTIQIHGLVGDSCKLILDFLNLDKPFVGM